MDAIVFGPLATDRIELYATPHAFRCHECGELIKLGEQAARRARGPGGMPPLCVPCARQLEAERP